MRGELERQINTMNEVSNNTQYFKEVQEPKIEVGQVLEHVYNALSQKGYNPVTQIVG